MKVDNYHCSPVLSKDPLVCQSGQEFGDFPNKGLWWSFALWNQVHPLFLKREKNQGLLVVFCSLLPLLAMGWGFCFHRGCGRRVAYTWRVEDILTVLAYWDTGTWTSWWLPSLPFFSYSPKISTLEAMLLVFSHLPQEICETLAPHSSATTRGVSSFRVELWPSWPAPPAPKVHTNPSLKMKKQTTGSMHYWWHSNGHHRAWEPARHSMLYGT